ncbi:MAG: four helix bundle protein [Tepidisphaeraceae bacterium]
MPVSSYKELLAWQRAMELAEEIYRLTRSFPDDERFGLTNQMRRSAVSIASNIAEGQGRGAGSDFARFLRIANGSRQELETQLALSYRIGMTTEASAGKAFTLIDKVGRLTAGLLKSIRDS